MKVWNCSGSIAFARSIHFQNARVGLRRGGAQDLDREISESQALDLAERGLLLSYVLSVGGKPCAVALGTRFRDTLVIHSFRHDKALCRP